ILYLVSHCCVTADICKWKMDHSCCVMAWPCFYGSLLKGPEASQRASNWLCRISGYIFHKLEGNGSNSLYLLLHSYRFISGSNFTFTVFFESAPFLPVHRFSGDFGVTRFMGSRRFHQCQIEPIRALGIDRIHTAWQFASTTDFINHGNMGGNLPYGLVCLHSELGLGKQF
ncbi:hypothetical protein LCGC14_2845850, partial [marine sediment metagenome]